VLAVAAGALATAPAAAAALSLGVTAPLSTMTITPGTTAIASTSLLVTPDPLNPSWTLSIADTTGHGGHLARATTGCTGVEAQTANALTVRASGRLPATVSTGTKTVGGSSQALASGNVLDTVDLTFSLVIGSNEILSTACTMSTTVTYTLQ
jgi:hypothetical protein